MSQATMEGRTDLGRPQYHVSQDSSGVLTELDFVSFSCYTKAMKKVDADLI
jgi:hypothetical protein